MSKKWPFQDIPPRNPIFDPFSTTFLTPFFKTQKVPKKLIEKDGDFLKNETRIKKSNKKIKFLKNVKQLKNLIENNG